MLWGYIDPGVCLQDLDLDAPAHSFCPTCRVNQQLVATESQYIPVTPAFVRSKELPLNVKPRNPLRSM